MSEWHRRNFGFSIGGFPRRRRRVGLTVWPSGLVILAVVALVIVASVNDCRGRRACEVQGGTWSNRNCRWVPAGKTFVYSCDHYCRFVEAPR